MILAGKRRGSRTRDLLTWSKLELKRDQHLPSSHPSPLDLEIGFRRPELENGFSLLSLLNRAKTAGLFPHQ